MLILHKNKVIQTDRYSDFIGKVNGYIPARECRFLQGNPPRGLWCELDDELIAMLPQDNVEDGEVVFRRGVDSTYLPISSCIAAFGPDGPCFAHPDLRKTGLQTSPKIFKLCMYK